MTDEAITDADLLRRFVDGDDSAFVSFVQRHHQPLTRWIRRSIGPHPEVDDIVQETFMAVLRGAQSFAGDGSAKAWLFGIARRRVARQFRRHSGEPEHHEPLEELGLRAGWGDPELSAARAETAERVHAALDALEPNARDILVLRDVEGFSTPETAEILQLTIPATKSRLHRARLALMAELREEAPDGA